VLLLAGWRWPALRLKRSRASDERGLRPPRRRHTFRHAASTARSLAPTGSRAAVANGRNFPDALAAAGIARTLGAPALLVDQPETGGTLPHATQTALDELQA